MNILWILKEKGACRNASSDLFFPQYDSPSSTELAIKICDGCTFRAECLDWALDHNETGVWGGTSETTRRSLKRSRSRSRCVTCQSYSIVADESGKHEFCLSCGISWPV